MKKNINKKVLGLVAVLGLIVLGYLFAIVLQQQANPLGVSLVSPQESKLATTIVNPKDDGFEIEMEDSYSVSDSGKLQIPIDVKGCSSGAGKGLSGVAVKVSGLPSYVTNPQLTLSGKSWTVNKAGSGSSYNFTANGESDPLTADKDEFLKLSFDVGTVKLSEDDNFKVEVEVDDNSIPSKSHVLSAVNVKLSESGGSGGGSGDYSLNLPSSVTISSSSFTLPVGVKGAGSSNSSKVTAIELRLSSLPSYVSSCSVSAKKSEWTAMAGDLKSGSLKINALGNANPLVSDESNVVEVKCQVDSGANEKTINIEGDLTTGEQKIKSLGKKSVTIKPSTQSPNPNPTPTPTAGKYSISGTISGDTKKDVTVSCGEYKDKSNSDGSFKIENVPDGTYCSLTPKKDDYKFEPSSRSVKVQGSNVTGQKFKADKRGESKDNDDDDDDDDKVSTATSAKVAPKTGPAENFIVITALVVGLLGAVGYVGMKMKWFS